ncbi:hypothetical protein [Yimella sp. NH-Cas1]|uniref:hypothetical protein n=1 Tax=Yimella sp. NH-Cas1 TaxID=2917726 RepID=UPI001EFA47B9|nr:hypothetical protein [Yimella sp. NH-Cas1]MCG8656760.1 hypothetical protein [Yimella sp. NH-Cas1]
MGQSKAERTWRTPRSTRHVWVRLHTTHPHEPPRQGLVVAWRRQSYEWSCLVVLIDDAVAPGEDPFVVMRWVPAAIVRPLPADPNRAFGLR